MCCALSNVFYFLNVSFHPKSNDNNYIKDTATWLANNIILLSANYL